VGSAEAKSEAATPSVHLIWIEFNDVASRGAVCVEPHGCSQTGFAGDAAGMNRHPWMDGKVTASGFETVDDRFQIGQEAVQAQAESGLRTDTERFGT
jgi:hypothetical protein